MTLFRANRRRIAQLVQHIPDALERSISIEWPHKPEEHVSVGWLLEMQADHGAGHIRDIEAIRRAHGLLPGL
jgi:hypothetical protein